MIYSREARVNSAVREFYCAVTTYAFSKAPAILSFSNPPVDPLVVARLMDFWPEATRSNVFFCQVTEVT